MQVVYASVMLIDGHEVPQAGFPRGLILPNFLQKMQLMAGDDHAHHHDDEIFGEGVGFKPARLYRMARSKAYLFRGVQIKWSCDPSRIHDQTPPEATFHFPNGLADFLAERTKGLTTVTPESFSGRIERQGEAGATAE